MQRHSSSSAEESILTEQVRKLFAMCDVEKRGVIGKSELQAITDLIPQKQMTSLEKKIGDQFIDEKQFDEIMQSLVAEEESREHVSDSNSPQGFGEGVSLADELEDAAKTKEILEDPLAEMIRTQLEEHDQMPYPTEIHPLSESHLMNQEESHPDDIHTNNNYPYVVTNSTMPRAPPPFIEPITFKKPHFRPIEPDMPSFPIGAQSLADELAEAELGSSSYSTPEVDLRTPDRIFKVVFVGDSAVGKTCFLHRFCHNRFKPLFNATIGVDFTVKTIQVKDRLVALQLWDTAGQERFRAITKQYFRKADGVVLMFDVTSEQSLLNVRNWIDSVHAGVDESTVLCLVGNKVDLFGSDSARNSVYRAGKKLAEEFGMSFFETSAFTGYGIETCMRCIAERLQQREEKHLEEALRLEMMIQEKKRSWCCV